VDFIVKRVATLLDITESDVWREGKTKAQVRARSLFCYWVVRELGVSMTSMARRLNISTVVVSKSVARGAGMAKKDGLELI
jgi:putative transposase